MSNEELKEAISFAYSHSSDSEFGQYGSRSISKGSELMIKHLEALLAVQLERAKGAY